MKKIIVILLTSFLILAANILPRVSLGPASNNITANGINNLISIPAYGVDLWTDKFVDARTWTTISFVSHYAYYAGDFMWDDFSKLYVIDYYSNHLQTINTTTGEIIDIGYSEPINGQTWTGLASSPDGIMYASSSDCFKSWLYTINLDTGEATVIGEIINATAVIDIAVSPSGDMYGLDIWFDALIKIDPTTGENTMIGEIGSIGFNANSAQDMDFDISGTLYLAAYSVNTDRGEFRKVNLQTGMSILVGIFPNGDEVDAFAFSGTVKLPFISYLPLIEKGNGLIDKNGQ